MSGSTNSTSLGAELSAWLANGRRGECSQKRGKLLIFAVVFDVLDVTCSTANEADRH